MDGAGKSSAQGGLIAFVQPFGLRDSSGGGRILRALLRRPGAVSEHLHERAAASSATVWTRGASAAAAFFWAP
jgi:hypothetical protein